MRQQGQIDIRPSACETTGYASLISWPVDTDRSGLATLLVRGLRISISCISAPSTSSLRAVTTLTVMRKMEKRTGTWRGLGNLLSLEIDDRAHDVED